MITEIHRCLNFRYMKVECVYKYPHHQVYLVGSVEENGNTLSLFLLDREALQSLDSV